MTSNITTVISRGNLENALHDGWLNAMGYKGHYEVALELPDEVTMRLTKYEQEVTN